MKKIFVSLKTTLLIIFLSSLSMTATGQEMLMLDETANASVENRSMNFSSASSRVTLMITGDVNMDGLIDVEDVIMLINSVLAGQSITNGDVNEDGIVDVEDVTTLINGVLTGTLLPNLSETQALKALHEVYRSMRTAGWSTTGNTHQAFGISAYNLTAEVMGDDMVMGAQGSGWFWFDAAYNVKSRYTSNSWRSHDLWYAYYTWISNANFLLKNCNTLSGTMGNYIKGQAYAIRAYSYFMLAQWFARTYVGHEDDPCVPIYNGTDFNGSTGQLRATVAEVYAQIDNDIDKAIQLLHSTTQLNPEHIGYAVALGLRARIALVEEDWNTAYNSASNAISYSGKSVLNVPDFMGVNDATAGNVMWGAQIPADEVGMYASFWAHMINDRAYGQRAPKQISKWLYNKISTNDSRRSWWTENTTGVGSDAPVQAKFAVKEGTEWEGDYIWMRVEEMYLTAAEAACRLGRTSTAKNNLNALMSKRVPNYTCNKTGTSLGALTNEETGSLLEEILIQRRIELWGEDGRLYTIRRLRQGFERNADDGWPTQLLLTNHTINDPEAYTWVLTIPAAEFNNYYARMIEDADQNPVGDYPNGAGVDIEREPQHISFVQDFYSKEIGVTDSYNCVVSLTRPNTSSKPYYALLRLTEDGSQNSTWYYVTFNANQRTSNISIYFSGPALTIGRHNYTLTLTDLEMSVATSSQRTSTRIQIDCNNIGAEGQHISFATAEQKIETYQAGYVEVPVLLTRAVTTNDYRAVLSISNQTNPDDISLEKQYVVFQAGESTATVNVYFFDTEVGNTYSCVLSLSDNDIATANPSLGAQITSTTVTVEVKDESDGWVSAGTCTFTDTSWEGEEYPHTATNVPVQRLIGTTTYRIVSPLYYVYNGYLDNPSKTNWKFTLNDDGSITPPNGLWELNYWGYLGEYRPNDFPTYCYMEQDGNTYDIHFMLYNNGNHYTGGHFTFTWDR